MVGKGLVAVRIIQSAIIAPCSRNNGVGAFPDAVDALQGCADPPVDNLGNILPFHKACPVISVVIGYCLG
ncbi:hypothetical protein D3C76_1746920 [compost metagenome]